MSESADLTLVAKRSCRKGKLRSAITKIKPRQTKFTNPRRWHAIARQSAKIKPAKKTRLSSIPKITPEIRRQAFESAASNTGESDGDILVLHEEDIEFGDERGRLLRKSTLRPEPSVTETHEPDPIPPNSVSNVKRIVRIVKRPVETQTSNTIGTQTIAPVKPKTVSIGIQVGGANNDLLEKTSFLSAGPEPPLRSYWTHKVNLPYPPGHYNSVQAPLAHFANGQQHQQYQQFVQPQYQVPIHQGHGSAHNYNQLQPCCSHQQAGITRRNRRNFVKSQKHQQRLANRQYQ